MESTPNIYYYLFFFFKNHDTKNDIYEDLVEVEVLATSLIEAVEEARKVLGTEKRDRFVVRKIIIKTEKN